MRYCEKEDVERWPLAATFVGLSQVILTGSKHVNSRDCEKDVERWPLWVCHRLC